MSNRIELKDAWTMLNSRNINIKEHLVNTKMRPTTATCKNDAKRNKLAENVTLGSISGKTLQSQNELYSDKKYRFIYLITLRSDSWTDASFRLSLEKYLALKNLQVITEDGKGNPIEYQSYPYNKDESVNLITLYVQPANDNVGELEYDDDEE